MANPLNTSNIPPLNPQLTQMLQQPGAQQFLQQLSAQNPGKSPREMAYQLAQQKGIDSSRFDQLVNRLGLK